MDRGNQSLEVEWTDVTRAPIRKREPSDEERQRKWGITHNWERASFYYDKIAFYHDKTDYGDDSVFIVQSVSTLYILTGLLYPM